MEANSELEGSPTLINEDPYGKGVSRMLFENPKPQTHRSRVYSPTLGWLCKLKLSNPSEVDGLLDEAAYEKHTAAE